MNPVGETFPSRPKGRSGPTLPWSQDALSNLRWLSSATGPHPSHWGNLSFLPVSATHLLQRWAAQTPSAVGAAGTDSPPAPCWVSAAHHTVGLGWPRAPSPHPSFQQEPVSCAYRHSSALFATFPSPGSLFQQRAPSECEAGVRNGQKAISNGTKSTPGPNGDW